MFIVINGGGKVGAYLGRTLGDKGHHIAIIEKRPEILDRMAEDLPSTILLIEGDGCSLKHQEDAGVARADVFVAVTGEDEDNLVSCQLAKARFGVKRTVARVNNPKNERIFRELGIEGISSTSVISQLIEEEMTAGDILTLHVLEKGRLALVEVLMPDDHGSASHQAIADLTLPEKTVLVSVVRGEMVIVPRGSTRLEPGDRVIAITAVEREKELRRVLAGM
ncbi:MAG TPA: NAD-binding protein [Candidatus Baltobacteraceae bacterium]|nr:NAD-binding protein [Candidatus Baltobacteraceae bacterium]